MVYFICARFQQDHILWTEVGNSTFFDLTSSPFPKQWLDLPSLYLCCAWSPTATMQTSSIRRQMKNAVHSYTDAEIKVREATCNDPWGPPVSLMSEISDLTFNVVAFADIMRIIWKRLNDNGKNWRHVFKALVLLEHLVKTGSERVVKACKENIHSIQTLKDFQYIDRDGHDQGATVREKAKRLASLLRDEEKLKKERSHALKSKSRVAGLPSPLDRSMSSSSFDSDLPPSYPCKLHRAYIPFLSRCPAHLPANITAPWSKKWKQSFFNFNSDCYNYQEISHSHLRL